MEPSAYHLMRQVEESHWWFRARRDMLSDQLARIGLQPKGDILDAGCGTGGNYAALSRFGKVFGFDSEPNALMEIPPGRYAELRVGKLPDQLPFGERRFDLVVLIDVLEHVHDDRAALEAIHGLMQPQGIVLLTVPAFSFLWSVHDELLRHQRRYRREEVVSLLRKAGFTVRRATYFNFWLFPVAAALRLFGSDRLVKEVAFQAPPPRVNQWFYRVMASERTILRYCNFPYGLSVMAVAARTRADEAESE